jgi:hypothetical protein
MVKKMIDFSFICINNNNNTGITGADEDNGGETGQCADIEFCFEENLFQDFELLTNALENGITVPIKENHISLNRFADICEALEDLSSLNSESAVLYI